MKQIIICFLTMLVILAMLALGEKSKEKKNLNACVRFVIKNKTETTFSKIQHLDDAYSYCKEYYNEEIN